MGIFNVRGCAGAYTITHIATGKIYVGSSEDLRRRQRRHVVNLRRGICDSKLLQEAYNQDPRLKFYSWIAENAEQALDLEQELLDHYRGTGLLFNLGTDVRKPRKGIPFGSEARRKLLVTLRSRPEILERARIRGLARVGSTHTPESLAKMREMWGKKVSVNGVVYDSIKAAAKAFEVDPATINNRCNNTSPHWYHYQWVSG